MREPLRRQLVAIATVAVACACVAAVAAARTTVHLRWAHCIRTCDSQRVLNPGGSAELGGGPFTRHMKVVFTIRRGRRHARVRVAARLAGGGRLTVHVPRAAISGTLYVTGRQRARSNALRVTVRRLRRRPAPPAVGASGTALDGTGMWIWYVSQSSGGTAAGILAQAHQHGVRTVFVKSSDGTNAWSQFSPALVS